MIKQMLEAIGVGFAGCNWSSRPCRRRFGCNRPLDLTRAGDNEFDALNELHEIASKNKVNRSFIGKGYSDTITPA